ncbi:Modification methylase DsaV [Labeo rohita]|uniref:Modification methylase DsaV n=1 Tax=Labeo rohita TaxID=84645 RepID=A0ABQ8MLA7_LABRO|nr:Modification methylase DsaV [Labeo rohita]
MMCIFVLYFSALMTLYFMCSTCTFIISMFISVKEAFLYQVHICKFSVIVSVRSGKCITFKIPQLKESMYFISFSDVNQNKILFHFSHCLSLLWHCVLLFLGLLICLLHKATWIV